VALGVAVRQFEGVFPTLGGITDDRVFIALTDLGMFFLMLLAGVEMHPSELAESSGKAFSIAIGGMLIPLGLGFGLGQIFLPESDLRFAQSFFLGVAMAITAVPVAVKILIDLGRLQSRAGRVIVSAALFDDVMSLALLAVLTGLIESGSLPSAGGLGLLAGKIVLFFGLTLLAGRYLFPLLGRLLNRVKAPEFEFSMLLVTAFAYAVLAEMLSMHFIIGAFMAGLFFGRGTVDETTFDDVSKKLSGLTSGFLAPVFFVAIGLHLEPGAIRESPGFLGLLIVLAFAGKVIGAAAPARLVGLDNREAVTIGFGMSARGAVELVIADIALRGGLFAKPEGEEATLVRNLFSAVVVMAIVTTIAAPVILRWLFTGDEAGSEQDRGEDSS